MNVDERTTIVDGEEGLTTRLNITWSSQAIRGGNVKLQCVSKLKYCRGL